MAAYRTRDARGVSSTNDCRDPAIGGVAAEMMFDDDFRCGSSLDEVALFDGLCSNVSLKT
jgi:hypothetical protein